MAAAVQRAYSTALLFPPVKENFEENFDNFKWGIGLGLQYVVKLSVTVCIAICFHVILAHLKTLLEYTYHGEETNSCWMNVKSANPT